ncbi:NAD(P)-dependent oxidoreductase, partial [Escherichia coli]
MVVSSGRFTAFGADDLLPALKAAGVKRLAVVGGAGNLEIAPGKALIDTPEFPAEYMPEASGGRDFLN